MKSLQIRSIQMKIALWAGGCLTLVTVILIGYGVWRLRTQALDAAQEQAITLSESHAAHIKAEVELALDAARTMAQALTAVKSQNIELTRDEVNAMLKQLTTENPNFVGTWTIWEADAFDGKDAEYAGQAPYDHTGRFIAYWNRNDISCRYGDQFGRHAGRYRQMGNRCSVWRFSKMSFLSAGARSGFLF